MYIPILNIPNTDIRLRPEFLALFKYANIKREHIIGLEDLPSPSELEKNLPPGNTRWILVDHNSFQHELGSIYSNRVHGVIDHHEEEHSVPEDTDPEPRVIEKAGSCTSLVVRTFQKEWQIISNGDGLANNDHLGKLWDSQLAKLALGSIVTDTSNLTSQHKVTGTDIEAVKYLENKMDVQDAPFDRKAFYKELKVAKEDIDNFEVKDILRKDWKQWTEKDGKSLGIASVVKPLEFLTTKGSDERNDEHGLETIIQEIMEDRGLSVFAIMTNSKAPEGGRKRELLLQALPSATAIRKLFDNRFNESLQLDVLDLPGVRQGEEVFRNVWIQRDVSKSRKQVAPLLRQSMNEA